MLYTIFKTNNLEKLQTEVNEFLRNNTDFIVSGGVTVIPSRPEVNEFENYYLQVVVFKFNNNI